MTQAVESLVQVTDRAQQEIRLIFDREGPVPGTGLRLGVIGEDGVLFNGNVIIVFRPIVVLDLGAQIHVFHRAIIVSQFRVIIF